MQVVSGGLRDRLLLIGLAVLVSVLGVGLFLLADSHHVDRLWVYFVVCTLGMIPAFLRAFRGHLKKPLVLPFLAAQAVVHGLVFTGLIKWQVSVVYWFPIFIVEFSVGAWAAHRFFGIVPSGDV